MASRQELSRYLRQHETPSVIDVHTHCGIEHIGYMFRRYPTSQSIKDLVLKMKSAQVDFAVTFPFASSYYYFDFTKFNDHLTLKPLPAEKFPYRTANQQLFYEIKLFGEEKIIPFPMIFPGLEDQQQIEYLDKLGKKDLLFGLKLHSLMTKVPAIRLANSEYLALAEKYNVPVLIHTGHDAESRPEQVLELAILHPNIRFCIAHVGRFEKIVFENLSRLKTNNLFFDTSPFSAICYLTPLDIQEGRGGEKLDLPYDQPAAALLQLYNMYPEGLLWGTDEPWTSVIDNKKQTLLKRVDYEQEKEILDILPHVAKQKIAFQNTVRFLFGNR
jgi:predicted TIM-barrel fold metal-dependent hydrolase